MLYIKWRLFVSMLNPSYSRWYCDMEISGIIISRWWWWRWWSNLTILPCPARGNSLWQVRDQKRTHRITIIIHYEDASFLGEEIEHILFRTFGLLIYVQCTSVQISWSRHLNARQDPLFASPSISEVSKTNKQTKKISKSLAQRKQAVVLLMRFKNLSQTWFLRRRISNCWTSC